MEYATMAVAEIEVVLRQIVAEASCAREVRVAIQTRLSYYGRVLLLVEPANSPDWQSSGELVMKSGAKAMVTLWHEDGIISL